MSAFEWNKVIGAILVALLVIKVADIAGDAVLHAKAPEQHAYPVAGFTPAAPSGGGQEKKGIQVPPIAPLLASATAEDGKKLSNKCTVCHTFEKGGAKKVGPNLYGVVGSDIAQGDFNYSPALKGVEGNWDYEALNKFLYDPRQAVPGVRMAFSGLKDDKERAAMIAYLRSLSDNPAPLPQGP